MNLCCQKQVMKWRCKNQVKRKEGEEGAYGIFILVHPYWIHIPSFNYDKPLEIQIVRMMSFMWWLTLCSSVSMLNLRSKYVCAFWDAKKGCLKTSVKNWKLKRSLETYLHDEEYFPPSTYFFGKSTRPQGLT